MTVDGVNRKMHNTDYTICGACDNGSTDTHAHGTGLQLHKAE
jgi:hypothetical protein